MSPESREWMDKHKVMNDQMPALSARVFSLRNRSYMGCGFHYGMEKRLGAILRTLNDFDSGVPDISMQVVTEIGFESLMEDVDLAELSAMELSLGDQEKSNG